eukprot:1146217-Pelagomonas_calceolata.AAC.2
MVGMIRFEKEDRERAYPAIRGSCPALQNLLEHFWTSLICLGMKSKQTARADRCQCQAALCAQHGQQRNNCAGTSITCCLLGCRCRGDC